jgi:hypothetical protein
MRKAPPASDLGVRLYQYNERNLGMIFDKAKTLLRRFKNKLRKDPDGFLGEVSGVVHVGAKETLEKPPHSRDNGLVIAGKGWVHGRQAAGVR